MPYYRVTGEIPRKRHVRFQRPDGGLYSEELMGEEGFVSDSSLLYHVHPPTAIVKSEGISGTTAGESVPNHPLVPRHVRTTDLPRGGDLVLGRQLLFANDDVQISFAAADAPSELYRNSSGDEAIYLQYGSARFESVYGAISAVADSARNDSPLGARSPRRDRTGCRGQRAHPAAPPIPFPVRAVARACPL